MIIGGHTHSFMEQPIKVNNILIAQAGTGTDQIGRYDIVVDDDTNSVIDWKWQLVPINDHTSEVDKDLEKFINNYKTKVDEKYNSIVTRFSEKLTHPKREEETTLGNLFADALADVAETDVILIGSGSIRVKELGSVVTLGDLKACFPFDDSLMRYVIKGQQLKRIFFHIMRKENRNSEGECYQINSKVKAIYSDSRLNLVSLTIDETPVIDEKEYTVTLQSYHFVNSKANLGISNEELMALSNPKVVSTSAYQVLEEWLRHNQNITRKIEGRIVFIE